MISEESIYDIVGGRAMIWQGAELWYGRGQSYYMVVGGDL